MAAFVGNFVQHALFGIVADRLTKRIRMEVFNKMIKMPCKWFDEPKNNSGTLAARLSTDCKNMNGVTSSYMGIVIQNISCLASGMIISLIYEWRVALVTIGLTPFMVATGIIQIKALTGFS